MDSQQLHKYFTQQKNAMDATSASSRADSSLAGPFGNRSEQSSVPDRFMTPRSMARTISALSNANARGGGDFLRRPGPRYFHSRRIRKDQIVKSWTKDPKDPKEKWVTIIPLVGLFLGLCIAAFIIWDGIRSVVNHQYCMVLDEDWSQGFRSDIWQAEIQVGGFG